MCRGGLGRIYWINENVGAMVGGRCSGPEAWLGVCVGVSCSPSGTHTTPAALLGDRSPDRWGFGGRLVEEASFFFSTVPTVGHLGGRWHLCNLEVVLFLTESCLRQAESGFK